jgi:hypothetical protein
LSQVGESFREPGDGVCIGGRDPEEPNLTTALTMAKFELAKSKKEAKKVNKSQSLDYFVAKDREDVSVYEEYDIAGASGNDEIIVGGTSDGNAGRYDAEGGTGVVIYGTSGDDEITGYGSDDEKRAGVLGGIRAHNVKRGDQRVGSVSAKRTRRFEKMSLDPVGWFTKDDALAVQKGLESQLGSVDPSDLPFAEVKSPLFATGTESLPSIF